MLPEYTHYKYLDRREMGSLLYNEHNPPICLRNQIVYCNRHQYPVLVPPAGICFHCGQNVFSNVHDLNKEQTHHNGPVLSIGFTQEEARETYITACPHCGEEF